MASKKSGLAQRARSAEAAKCTPCAPARQTSGATAPEEKLAVNSQLSHQSIRLASVHVAGELRSSGCPSNAQHMLKDNDWTPP
jgi:hypothetical protein